MAHSHPGAGSVVPSMPPAPHRPYSKAFFQACDDTASPFQNQNGIHGLRQAHLPANGQTQPRLPSQPQLQPAPAPASSRDVKEPAASSFINHSAVKHETALYSPAADGLLSLRADQDFPSTLELAEGLIMMRASVEPVHALPQRNPFTHPPPHHNLAATNHNGLASFPIRASSIQHSSRPSSAAAPPLDHLNSHPPASRPPEDNIGRRTDVLFPTSPNISDTMPNPNANAALANGWPPIPQAPVPSHQDRMEQSVPRDTETPPWLSGLFTINGNGANRDSVPSLVKDSPSAQLPSCRLYDPAAPIAQCSCHAVPGIFLEILDEKQSVESTTLPTLINLYGACKDDLCSLHLSAYARLVTNALEIAAPPKPASADAAPLPTIENENASGATETDNIPTLTGSSTRWTAVPIRRRATSLPDIYEIELQLPAKRRRTTGLEQAEEQDTLPLPQERQAEVLPEETNPEPASHRVKEAERPFVDLARDEAFRQQVLYEISQHFTDTKEDEWSRGETTNRLVHTILSKCQSPNTDANKGPVDADMFDGEEALEAMERRSQTIPMFTEGQQHFQWSNNGERPIEQLFNRIEDLTKQVSIQIPSRGFNTVSFEKRSLGDVKARFLRGTPSEDPWNALDLRSPLPHSVLPRFLTGENCQLLPRIRDSLLEGHSGERTRSSREDWNEWTELLEWVLVSEGGHNTSPHMDSHGWSTWITIQEGEFGFGWLARPTVKEQNAWIADPLNYTGGNWRFVILRPGQTVYFPTGTIHFVFRLHAQQTLAVGGHVLQWTGLERWAQTILLQLKNPDTTNEDMGTSPLKYVRSVSEMVNARTLASRIESLGGMATVQKFMLWVSEIERWFKMETEKLEKKKKKKKRVR